MAGTDDRQGAFRRLYDATYPRLAAYARRRLPVGEADDALAEVYLVAWRRFEDIPSGDEALLWLYGVARRVISQDRRSERRRGRLQAKLTAVESPGAASATDTEQADERMAIQSALALLREHDRELLRLSQWEDLNHEELARVFHCTTNAIAIRLHRAHRRFSQALREIESDAGEPLSGESSR
jgi:RNA polymerase sigma-70 factor (ECF subfamily)